MSNLQLAQLRFEPNFSNQQPITSETALTDGLAQVLAALLTQEVREKALGQAKTLYKTDPELSLALSGTLFYLSQQIVTGNLMRQHLDKILMTYKDRGKDNRLKKTFESLQKVFETPIEIVLNYDRHWQDSKEILYAAGHPVALWLEKQTKPLFDTAYWERSFVEAIANELARLGRVSSFTI